jgi:NADPH2:quinone reductase
MSSIAASMRAWQVIEPGDPREVMRLLEVDVPEPGPGQVLIEVWSIGLNYDDVLLARGQHPKSPAMPFTPGLEMCGIVVGVGAGVPAHTVGERVIGTVALPHGSLARYTIAQASDVLPAPPGLDDTHASALHVAYQTAWFGLYRRAGLRVGETVLIHAAAGGVGSAAVQLAKAAGARVIGVVGGSIKAELARRNGCDTVIDRTGQDVVATVRQATGERGVHVAFDPVGGAAHEVSSQVIAFEGRIVVVGFAGGQVSTVPLSHPQTHNYSVIGLNWSRYATAAPELVRRCHDDLCRLVAANGLRPVVSQRLAFDEAPEGLHRLGAAETVGRVTVLPPE